MSIRITGVRPGRRTTSSVALGRAFSFSRAQPSSNATALSMWPWAAQSGSKAGDLLGMRMYSTSVGTTSSSHIRPIKLFRRAPSRVAGAGVASSVIGGARSVDAQILPASGEQIDHQDTTITKRPALTLGVLGVFVVNPSSTAWGRGEAARCGC